ncbi:hypothetical protein D3C77_361930 [compost metagenome]
MGKIDNDLCRIKSQYDRHRQPGLTRLDVSIAQANRRFPGHGEFRQRQRHCARYGFEYAGFTYAIDAGNHGHIMGKFDINLIKAPEICQRKFF